MSPGLRTMLAHQMLRKHFPCSRRFLWQKSKLIILGCQLPLGCPGVNSRLPYTVPPSVVGVFSCPGPNRSRCRFPRYCQRVKPRCHGTLSARRDRPRVVDACDGNRGPMKVRRLHRLQHEVEAALDTTSTIPKG